MSRLSQYFTGIAAKRLSAVETDPETSNQHEFNGTKPMIELFGMGRIQFDCTYVYFDDEEDKTATAEGFLTWYDARENHATWTEYRLYFPGNAVMDLASSGDLLVIGKRADGRALALVAKKDTTVERQLLWLFGIEDGADRFTVNTIEGEGDRVIGYAFADVDDFVEFSLSVQNRRKSRVGFALENHLSEVFNQHGIAYSQGKATENKAKPDFIFPSIDQYRDPAFPVGRLTMLGSKSTCKDRWRQVLSEADRINIKHLFTLEPGISQNQTDEMRDKRLQLVLPSALHETYLPAQQAWLCNLSEFIDLVRQRQ